MLRTKSDWVHALEFVHDFKNEPRLFEHEQTTFSSIYGKKFLAKDKTSADVLFVKSVVKSQLSLHLTKGWSL